MYKIPARKRFEAKVYPDAKRERGRMPDSGLPRGVVEWKPGRFGATLRVPRHCERRLGTYDTAEQAGAVVAFARRAIHGLGMA